MAGCLLADYGARVIKVEHPTGEVARRLVPRFPGGEKLGVPHETVNRNKRNMTLDLKHPAGRDVFLELARSTDIIVQNFRPGRMAELGCGYEHVRAVKADIIYVSISGYGQYGPYARRAGYDPSAQAMSGLMWLNATGDSPPMKRKNTLNGSARPSHASSPNSTSATKVNTQ